MLNPPPFAVCNTHHPALKVLGHGNAFTQIERRGLTRHELTIVCTYTHTENMEVPGVEFDWDEGNWPKCGKHGVTKDEIETLFEGGPDVYPAPAHSQREERMLAIGTTVSGRWLLVAFTLRRRGREALIRPISARYMHEKEVKHYERQRKT